MNSLEFKRYCELRKNHKYLFYVVDDKFKDNLHGGFGPIDLLAINTSFVVTTDYYEKIGMDELQSLNCSYIPTSIKMSEEVSAATDKVVAFLTDIKNQYNNESIIDILKIIDMYLYHGSDKYDEKASMTNISGTNLSTDFSKIITSQKLTMENINLDGLKILSDLLYSEFKTIFDKVICVDGYSTDTELLKTYFSSLLTVLTANDEGNCVVTEKFITATTMYYVKKAELLDYAYTMLSKMDNEQNATLNYYEIQK